MEKKTYIKPEIEVMTIETQSHMMTASAPDIDIVKPGTGEGSEGGTDILSNRRRGTWGNLWHRSE